MASRPLLAKPRWAPGKLAERTIVCQGGPIHGHGHRVGVQHLKPGAAHARAYAQANLAHANLVRGGLGSPGHSNHETADIRFATDKKVVGIRSGVRA